MRNTDNLKFQGGFIGYIILIVAALALLKYFFDWSIFDALTSEQGKDTISYIRGLLDLIWSYLSVPVNYAWNEVIWPLIEWVLTKIKK
jgi:hypothetical protein